MPNMRPRLQKIATLYGVTLSHAWHKREHGLDIIANTSIDQPLIQSIIHRFANADPTDGKSRTQWLVQTYISDLRFKAEDFGRAHAALAAFERFKRQLSLEQRELNTIPTLSALEKLVDPFVKAEEKARLARDVSSATGREKRRLEELKARDESIIIQEEDGLATVAIPMTEFASKWWGRGTRWCTAAENGNAFQEHHQDVPLIVIITPEGHKFQAHITDYNTQFMDANDQDVTAQIVAENWTHLSPIIRLSLDQPTSNISLVPTDRWDLDLCRKAIHLFSMASFKRLPDNLRRHPDIINLVIQQHHGLLKIDRDLIDGDICKRAVHAHPSSLRYIPSSIPKDRAIIEIAISSPSKEKLRDTLYLIPYEILETNPDMAELVIQAIKDKCDGASVLETFPWIPTVRRDLFLQIAEKDPWLFEMGGNYQSILQDDFELACIVLQKVPSLYKKLSSKLKDDSTLQTITIEAMRNCAQENPDELSRCPPKFIDELMLMDIARYHPYMFLSISHSIQNDLKPIRLEILANPKRQCVIENPSWFQDEESCLAAISNSNPILDQEILNIPSRFLTHENILMAVQINPERIPHLICNIQCMPDIKKRDIYLEALRTHIKNQQTIESVLCHIPYDIYGSIVNEPDIAYFMANPVRKWPDSKIEDIKQAFSRHQDTTPTPK
jgi:hypothetical protein